MSPLALSALVDAARRTVRRDAVLAIAALVAAAVPVALLAAWLLGGLPAWSEPGASRVRITRRCWRAARRWMAAFPPMSAAILPAGCRSLRLPPYARNSAPSELAISPTTRYNLLVVSNRLKVK